MTAAASKQAASSPPPPRHARPSSPASQRIRATCVALILIAVAIAAIPLLSILITS